MDFMLENAGKNDIELLIEYKLNTIFEYANNLSDDEIIKINDYVKDSIFRQFDNYKIIKINNIIIGAFLVYKHLDGILLDEIFISESYRNKGIGTKIINNILKENKVVYLYVYKDNVMAYNLYKRLGFSVDSETQSRYFMKYHKI